LQVNVSQLLKSPIGTSRRLYVDDILSISHDKSSKIIGELNLIKTNRSVLVSGSLQTKIAVECCRCLVEFDYPVCFKIEEEYYPTIDIINGMKLPPQEKSEDNFIISDHHEIDISEAVRQYALLALPMKALCRNECPGIQY
jgi:uncharacterized protein